MASEIEALTNELREKEATMEVLKSIKLTSILAVGMKTGTTKNPFQHLISKSGENEPEKQVKSQNLKMTGNTQTNDGNFKSFLTVHMGEDDSSKPLY